MATIDIKAKPPLLTPDWTQMDGRNKPFLMDNPRRYCVTVVTQETAIGGKAEQIKDSAKPSGVDHILRYFDKEMSDDALDQAVAEDYYLPLRPNAKVKVLVSLPESYLLSLGEQPLVNQNISGAKIIRLNTFGINSDIDNANEFMTKYVEDIERFQGKLYGLDISKQASYLTEFIANLSSLMLDNDIQFSDNKSDLIEIYIDGNYNVLKLDVTQDLETSSRPKNMSKSFSSFLDNEAVRDKRTIKLLEELDNILNIQSSNTRVSWTKFVEDYIYNPPKFDFSATRPKSKNVNSENAKATEKDNNTPIKTQEEVRTFSDKITSPDFKKDYEDKLETVSDFVGDHLVSNLSQLSTVINNAEVLYTQLLNKLGIQDLVRSALECFNFPNLEVLDIAKISIEATTNISRQFQSTLSVPTIAFPNGAPIVDLLKDTSIAFAKTIANAVVGALIDLVINTLKSLFDLCKECSLEGLESSGVLAGDNFNFGGLQWRNLDFGEQFTQKVLNTSLGAITEGSSEFFDTESLSQEILTNTIERYDEMVLEAAKEIYEEEKKKDENFTFEQARQIVIEQNPFKSGFFEQASSELTRWLDASSTVMTPGELGNLLLGCEVSTEAKEVMSNLLDPITFPALSVVLDRSDLSKVWTNLGKLVNRDNILETVQDAAQAVPDSYKCLCDEDDRALRERILSSKDPSLTPEELQKQIDDSNRRRRQRINELLNISQNPDFLKDILPPLYCKVDDDGNIIPGIIPRTHPVLQSAINQSLDATFDSLTSIFNDDITRYVSNLSVDSISKKIVPRTKTAQIKLDDGSTEDRRILNPEFVSLVEEGRFSWGSLPDGAEVPGTRKEPSDDSDFKPGDKIKYSPFLYSLGFDSWGNKNGAGMWESGQTRPTAEQEYRWELANLNASGFGTRDFEVKGGRRFSSDPKNKIRNGGVDDIEYTRTFGYSPIPIEVSERGDRVFAPGMRETFIGLCSGSNRYLTIEEQPLVKDYNFKIPNNIAKNSGVDLEVIRENLSKVSGEITRIDSAQGSRELDEQTVSTITQSLDLVSSLEFDFKYDVPYQKDGQQISSSDTYNINIAMRGPSDFSMPVTSVSSSIDIPTNALRLIDQLGRVDYGNGAAQPQEGYFYNLLADKYKEFNTSFNTADYFTKLKNDQSYDGAFDDFICTISDQISDSPYLGLEEISKINFTPAKTFVYDSQTDTWNPQSCTPSLLDVNIIKERVMDEYSLSLCMKELYQDSNDFGGNEQDSYQVAKRSGIILLTMRVYVLEFLLRNVFSFHYFGFKEEKDIDDTMVEFLFDIFDKNLTSRSYGTSYKQKFQKETIELYNRNVPNSQKVAELQPDSFKVAAKYLLKGQILSVSKRLSRLVKQKGDASIHSILLEEWLPLMKIPTESNQSRFYEIPELIGSNPLNTVVFKPLKSMTESGELFIPSESLFRSVTSADGALTPETIKRMSGNPGSYGVLYLKPMGRFFREYFRPNDYNRKLSSVNYRGPEEQNNIATKTNEIWPDRIKQVNNKLFNQYGINNGSVVASDTPQFSFTAREAVLLGPGGNPQEIVEQPDGSNTRKTESEVGSLIYFAQKPNNPKDLVFDYGISESEKQMMTGSGGVVDFIAAARTWTVKNQNNTAKDRGTNPDFIMIGSDASGQIHPWYSENLSNSAKRLQGYYESRNVIGPGSFLHIVSDQRSPFDEPYTTTTQGKGMHFSKPWLDNWENFVLSPEQNNGIDLRNANSDWTKNVKTAIKDIGSGTSDPRNKQYISLLDLDMRMARNTLLWEKSVYQQMVDSGEFYLGNNRVTNDIRYELTPEQIFWYIFAIRKYDEWIAAMNNNIILSTQAQQEREELVKPVQELLRTSRSPRNEIKKADKLYDISNGNFFQEFYIRIEEYNQDDRLRPPQGNLDFIADRDEFLRGVVDINHFDDYMSAHFSETYPGGRRPSLINEVTLEECSDNLINDANIRTVIRPQTGGDSRLNDFFKSLKFGMRISYLPPPGAQVGGNSDPALSSKEKTYYLEDAGGKQLTPIPLTSVEIPIDMSTKMKEVVKQKQLPDPDNIESGITSKYFNWLFKSPKVAGQINTIPREMLMSNIKKTDEYEFLFRYSLSLDRMLSLTNIYSYSYLLTLPNVSNTFDPTKEKLMYDFLYSLRAGDYRAADCVNSNLDISNALENGIPIPWAAIGKLLIRTPLLIFKGFVEQSSLNIAFAKQIRESIKGINQIIANAQRQINAVRSSAASIAASAEALSDISVDNVNCGFGINSPQATVNPPEAWFDPVNETFIPVPETWMIGISLLPSDIFIFSPMPPVGYATGIPYWILDDGLINPYGPWLGELPVEDYIQKMLNGRNSQDTSTDVLNRGDDCAIDIGLLPPGNIHNNNK